MINEAIQNENIRHLQKNQGPGLNQLAHLHLVNSCIDFFSPSGDFRLDWAQT